MKKSLPVYLFLTLTALYVLLVMLLPTDPATLSRYMINQLQARLLNLTVVVPLVIIWYLAMDGFVRFWQYSKLIRGTNEGWSFTLLAYGLMVLAFGLPINSIVSAITNYVGIHNPDLLPVTTIIRNYVTLIFALVAFGLLAHGSVRLVLSHKDKFRYQPVLPLFMAPFMIVLSTIYTWLVVTNPSGAGSEQSAYHLPDWLIIFTIVIPYIVAWVAGLLAIYYLYLYRKKVKGTIYKQAFGQLATGIGVVTLISVFVQFLTTLLGQISRLHLTPILFIVYILVILYAVGFWYIAQASKKLQKFEEV